MVEFWILMVLGVGTGLGVGIPWFIYGHNEESWGHRIGAVLVALVLIVGTIVGGIIYRQSESGQRMVKSWESEMQEGISRTVTVYDLDGDVLAEYSGKFDVVHDNKRILFDDENGKRHIIYFTTGTIIIDETD